MKRITAIFLSLMLAASVFSIAFTAVAASTVDWEDLVALSDDAELDEEASSIENGRVTFKVTLPVDGYAQFQQPLRSLISYDTVNLNEQVTIVVGGNTKAEYNYSMLQVQLVGSADASTDIVPVDEVNGEDPGTQAMTWHLYGPRDDSDPIVSTAYGLNKGSSTASGAQFTMLSNIESHHLMMLFTEETNGTVTVSQRYGQNNSGYAYRRCASTYTLDDLNAEDGVYFRIRNNDPDEAITYTVTINSADVTTAYRSGDYTLSGGSTLDSSSVAYGNNIVYTFTSTLEADGGYVQLDRKLTALITGNDLDVKVVIGDGTSEDYLKTNFNLQLTADSAAKTDLTPIVEHNKTADQISTDALSYGVTYYSNGNIYFAKGLATTTGASPLASYDHNIFSSYGVQLRFTRNNDETVNCKWIHGGNRNYNSSHTLSEIGGEDGVYLRLRNNASETITYTVTVTIPNMPYTDGLYKFSGEGSTLISSSASLSGTKAIQTATFQLNGNGSYVQFDRKLTDLLATGNDLDVKVVIGDGTSEDYLKTNFNLQLTADSAAETDLTPIVEYNKTADQISTDALSYGVTYYSNGNIYFAKGLATTTGASPLASYDHNIFSSYGVQLRFTRNNDETVNCKWIHGGNRNYNSSHTLSEIGGEDGVYLRLRNNASETITYTMTVTYSKTPYDDSFYKFSDLDSTLISYSTSFDGQNIVETATFSLTANGGYAQLDRKLTDLVNNGSNNVKVIVGDGSDEAYAASNFNVQLVSDQDAESDIVPVYEHGGATPSTKGITWKVYSNSSYIYFGWGSSPNGGTYFNSPRNSIFPDGISMTFSKTEENKIHTNCGWERSLDSKQTISEIDGEDGIYLRIRNAASTAVTYTVTVKTAVVDFDRDGISGASDLIVLRRALLLEDTSEIPEADLNLDGKIDILDMIRLMKKQLG